MNTEDLLIFKEDRLSSFFFQINKSYLTYETSTSIIVVGYCNKATVKFMYKCCAWMAMRNV